MRIEPGHRWWIQPPQPFGPRRADRIGHQPRRLHVDPSDRPHPTIARRRVVERWRTTTTSRSSEGRCGAEQLASRTAGSTAFMLAFSSDRRAPVPAERIAVHHLHSRLPASASRMASLTGRNPSPHARRVGRTRRAATVSARRSPRPPGRTRRSARVERQRDSSPSSASKFVERGQACQRARGACPPASRRAPASALAAC